MCFKPFLNCLFFPDESYFLRKTYSSGKNRREFEEFIQTAAIILISTFTPLGKPFTATVSRAG